MFVSIVSTALLLNGAFAALGWVPGGPRQEIQEMTKFAVDYTFWLNVVFVLVAALMIWLHRRRRSSSGDGGHDHDHDDHEHDHDDSGLSIQDWVVAGCGVWLLAGLALKFFSG